MLGSLVRQLRVRGQTRATINKCLVVILLIGLLAFTSGHYLISALSTRHNLHAGTLAKLVRGETPIAPESMVPGGIPPVKYVFLLSYQRTGSSFTGGLFHSNPDTFYIYEPLDMLYSAMYGVTPGWTAPANIFYTSKGLLGTIPEDEVSAIAWTLEKIFTCSLSELPIMMLVHPFWHIFTSFMPDVNDYVKCMQGKKVDVNLIGTRCSMMIRTKCKSKFDRGFMDLPLCRDILWNKGQWYSSRARIDQLAGRSAHRFINYFSCLEKARRAAKECAQKHLDEICRQRTLRVVKTVRAPMEAAIRLLDRHPNLRLVHLLRDPRGVTKSRRQALWSWGHGEQDTPRSHASRYCPNAARDHKLMASYPDGTRKRSMLVVYDDFVQSPLSATIKIYSHMGADLPNTTLTWVKEHTVQDGQAPEKNARDKIRNVLRHKGNSTDIAASWREYYSQEELQEINAVCADFYRTVEYPWPNLSTNISRLSNSTVDTS